ncbi:hypothetical protein JOD27_008013 [Lentzea nigeriaca]|nr:hypothetical protein [Lentzea nigeriaca]
MVGGHQQSRCLRRYQPQLRAETRRSCRPPPHHWRGLSGAVGTVGSGSSGGVGLCGPVALRRWLRGLLPSAGFSSPLRDDCDWRLTSGPLRGAGRPLKAGQVKRPADPNTVAPRTQSQAPIASVRGRVCAVGFRELPLPGFVLPCPARFASRFRVWLRLRRWPCGAAGLCGSLRTAIVGSVLVFGFADGCAFRCHCLPGASASPVSSLVAVVALSGTCSNVGMVVPRPWWGLLHGRGGRRGWWGPLASLGRG